MIDKQAVSNMLMGAVAQIREHHQYLSELDAATGDGDHGSTILKVMNNLADAVQNAADTDTIKDIFFNAGMAAASTDGGSSAPLIGSFFMGMADPVEGKDTLTPTDLAEVIKAGIESIKADSSAQIGDKTMMDALLPVLNHLNANPVPDTPSELMNTCAKVAADGAEATKNFIAKFGRARNLGERVLGHADAGANSIAFIFKGMAESF